MQALNWPAIVLAAIGSFLLGGPWYSKKVFGALWGREAGQTAAPSRPKHPAKVFAVSFVFSLVAATAFAWWLGPQPTLATALGRGLIAGACFVATSFGINYQFAGRSTRLWLIDGGYHAAQFAIYGLVIGLWR